MGRPERRRRQSRVSLARARPVPATAPAEPSIRQVSARHVSVADELQKLAALRDEGVLTEEEFAQQKAKLLNF